MGYEPTEPCPIKTPCKDFKLECVVVCDKFSDLLSQTLPNNKFLFDKMVVITAPEDKLTRKICEFHHVQCIPTDELNSRWGEFHKGKAINVGLDALDKDGWVIHTDADMWYPPQTRILLQQAELDPTMIYGCDRFIVKGKQAWNDFLEKPVLQHEANAYIHLNAFPIGTRVMHDFAQGWLPIGFMQLWHCIGSGVYTYPTEHTTAGRGDTIFSQKWPRAKRGFLPELVGYHLEAIDAGLAKDWAGRTSSPFTLKQSE
jgi:hypothetical protein